MAAEDEVAQTTAVARSNPEAANGGDAGAPASETAPAAEQSVPKSETTGAQDAGSADTTKDTTKPADKDQTRKEPDKSDWKARREADQKRDKDRRPGFNRNKGPPHRPIDYSKNIKSKFEDLPESSDPDEIRKQVEFYFSDSNLPSDKFLLSKVGGSANHPVPISVIHSFKRMRHFQPFSALVSALKASATLDVVDNDTAIQRKTPLPETMGSASFSDNMSLLDDATRPRSIYAKGFGAEGPTTQFDIEAFFAPYGPTNAIRLRRTNEKVFKGSVFVEFDSPATQAAFLALDPKPKWAAPGGAAPTDLQIMSKEQYVRGKADDIAAGRIRPSPSKHGRGRDDDDRHNGHRGRDRGGARGGRGGGRGGRDRERRRDRSRDRRADDERSASPRRRRGEDAEGEEAPAAETTTVEGEAESKKRARPADEDDGEAAKKSKTEAAA